MKGKIEVSDSRDIQLTTDPTTLTIDDDFRKKTVKNDRFINVDIKGLADIFNSYATKKTIATGFFNLALVSSNFAQMKQIITVTSGKAWAPLNIVCMTFVCLSLFLQFIVAIVLVFLAKQGEFIDEDKRNQLIRSNNGVTLLVLVISIINIFLNIFISF